MRGGELAKRLCRDRPGLKTLFMSGYLDSEAELGEAESAAFLQKPFSLAELARTVRDLLDGV
jgi:DNA-binding NtrC family response regulator